jgi:hypothetical protein
MKNFATIRVLVLRKLWRRGWKKEQSGHACRLKSGNSVGHRLVQNACDLPQDDAQLKYRHHLCKGSTLNNENEFRYLQKQQARLSNNFLGHLPDQANFCAVSNVFDFVTCDFLLLQAI